MITQIVNRVKSMIIGPSGDIAEVTENTNFDTNLDGANGLIVNGVMYGRIDDSTVKPIKQDGSTQDLQVVEHEHAEIHGGDHYMYCSYLDLSINHVLDLTWLMPNTIKWIHWTWALECESETLFQVYEAAVETNPLSNNVTPLNNNRNSINTSGTVLKFEDQSNLAAANTDTDVSGATLIESGIIGSGKRSLGNSERSREIILKQNTLYCLRATATAAGYVNFCMQWYEHTDKN